MATVRWLHGAGKSLKQVCHMSVGGWAALCQDLRFFFVQFFVGVQANEYRHKNWMNAQFAEVEVVTRQFFSFKGVSGGGVVDGGCTLDLPCTTTSRE